jgi:hypothetical protein
MGNAFLEVDAKVRGPDPHGLPGEADGGQIGGEVPELQPRPNLGQAEQLVRIRLAPAGGGRVREQSHDHGVRHGGELALQRGHLDEQRRQSLGSHAGDARHHVAPQECREIGGRVVCWRPVAVPADLRAHPASENVTALTGTLAAQLQGCPSRAVPTTCTG